MQISERSFGSSQQHGMQRSVTKCVGVGFNVIFCLSKSWARVNFSSTAIQASSSYPHSPLLSTLSAVLTSFLP